MVTTDKTTGLPRINGVPYGCGHVRDVLVNVPVLFHRLGIAPAVDEKEIRADALKQPCEECAFENSAPK